MVEVFSGSVCVVVYVYSVIKGVYIMLVEYMLVLYCVYCEWLLVKFIVWGECVGVVCVVVVCWQMVYCLYFEQGYCVCLGLQCLVCEFMLVWLEVVCIWVMVICSLNLCSIILILCSGLDCQLVFLKFVQVSLLLYENLCGFDYYY